MKGRSGLWVQKCVSIVLVCALLFSMQPYYALALPNGAVQYGKIGDAAYASLSADGVLTVFGEGDTYDYTQASPAPWYKDRRAVRSVVIANQITSLGDCLFFNCENLTGQLILPASLVRIGDQAFSGSSPEAAPKPRAIINEFVQAEIVTDAQGVQNTPAPRKENKAAPHTDPALPAHSEPPVSAQPNASETPTAETPVPNQPEVGQSEQAATPADEPEDKPTEPEMDTMGKTEPIPPENSAGETTPAPETAEENAIVEPQERPTKVITEQMLGRDIFFPGQSGVFYLAGAANKSFRAAAVQAGYTEVTDRAKANWSDAAVSPSAQQTLKKTVGGRQITVTGALPEGAQLSVEQVALETASQMVTEQFGQSTPSIRFAYDISILVDGKSYQPTDFGSSVDVSIGGVAVTEDFALLHFKADNTVETLPVQAQGGSVVFEADSFSVYIGVNQWVKLPDTIYCSDNNFYADEPGTQAITDANGVPFTDLQSILNHIDGDLTIYMKSGYTVSNTQSITGGTAYTVMLKRWSDSVRYSSEDSATYYTGSLITVNPGGNLTLVNIIARRRCGVGRRS